MIILGLCLPFSHSAILRLFATIIIRLLN